MMTSGQTSQEIQITDTNDDTWKEIDEIQVESILPVEVDKKERLPKCSKVEYESRINEVVEMLAHFASNAEIKKFMVEKYGLAPDSVKVYIQEATEEIIKSIPTPKEIIAQHIKAYKRISKNNEDSDARTSLIAMNNLEKLLHLHQPEIQLNNQTNNFTFEGIDNEDVMEFLKSLKNAGHQDENKLEAN